MTSNTRLCIVMGSHWDAQMGGAQYQAKCLVDVLIRRPDVETYYLARRVLQPLRRDGYEIVRFGTRRRGVGRFLSDLWALYRALDRLRPAVIYQRGLKAYTGVCAFYCLRHGARFVFHIAHDSDVSRAHFTNWGPAMLVRRLERRIAEYGMRRANVIVAQTRDQARMLRNEFGLEATAVVPNFHPIPADATPRREDGRMRVLWVANFKKRKNPEIFVDLAETFLERNDVRFVMIGRAGGEAYAQLHERMKHLGNLEYLGELPIEQVNEELAHSDIFVNTSSAEGFPNTFIQAWLRGTPVVSCFVDPDACLSQGHGGILAGSPGRLISVIGELLDNRERIRELGKLARAHGYANHHPDRARGLVELLLNDGRCPPREEPTPQRLSF
ncbi:MAG: glycosyltransferase family 4 protein [Steroidobacteraceae bacterium]